MDVERIDGVWMCSARPQISAARAVAVEAMRALGCNPEDFRERDKVIMAITPLLTQMLDGVAADPTGRPERWIA